MDRRLGATREFWVALSVSLLLHGLLILGAASRPFGFSWVSENSREGRPRAVTVKLVQNLVNPDANSDRASDQQPSDAWNSNVVGISGAGSGPDVVERLVGMQYQPLGQLTKLPRPIGDIDLNSPEITDHARQARITLRLSVSSSGLVDDVKVISVGDGNVGEEWIVHIIDRFRKTRFEPGEIDGRRVSTEFPVTVVVE